MQGVHSSSVLGPGPTLSPPHDPGASMETGQKLCGQGTQPGKGRARAVIRSLYTPIHRTHAWRSSALSLPKIPGSPQSCSPVMLPDATPCWPMVSCQPPSCTLCPCGSHPGSGCGMMGQSTQAAGLGLAGAAGRSHYCKETEPSCHAALALLCTCHRPSHLGQAKRKKNPSTGFICPPCTRGIVIVCLIVYLLPLQ